MSSPPGTGPSSVVTMGMVIVAGHLLVDPAERGAYLQGGREGVEQARRVRGWLDFADTASAITADLVDPSRINVYERWESQDAVEAFRGDGVSDEQWSMFRGARFAE